MEVHHHTNTPRKKWTHYFWEFLMLFLAVFCGFLAENEREHFVESKREVQYIKSFISDLKGDTFVLKSAKELRARRVRMCDSLITFLKSPERTKNTGIIYRLGLQLSSSNRFPYNDRTIQQLRNAGAMRLIRTRDASEMITWYDMHFRRMQLGEDQSLEVLNDYRVVAAKLFDASVFLTMVDSTTNIIKRPVGNPKLLNEDPQIINDVCAQLLFYRRENMWIANYQNDTLLPKASRTLAYLEEVYKLKQ